MKTRLTAYKLRNPADVKTPWRVIVNGKADPANRDFVDPSDIQECYDALRDAGLIEDYSLTILKAN